MANSKTAAVSLSCGIGWVALVDDCSKKGGLGPKASSYDSIPIGKILLCSGAPGQVFLSQINDTPQELQFYQVCKVAAHHAAIAQHECQRAELCCKGVRWSCDAIAWLLHSYAQAVTRVSAKFLNYLAYFYMPSSLSTDPRPASRCLALHHGRQGRCHF